MTQLRAIPRVGDKGEIPRARLLNAGDADDVDVVHRALQAAAEPFSDVSQLQ